MKKLCLMLLSISIIFSFLACRKVDIVFNHQNNVRLYEEEILYLDRLFEMIIINEVGNIEFYRAEDESIKFEILKKISGYEDEKVLMGGFNNIKYSVKEKDGKVTFEANFKRDKRNITSREINLRVYVPSKFQTLKIELGKGDIKIFDDIECDFSANVNHGNINIKRLEGSINIQGKTGNINIENAKINNEAFVTQEVGNININSYFRNLKSAKFKTEVGNINLNIDSDSEIVVQTLGKLEVNEFDNTYTGSIVRVVSKLGEISVYRQ